MQAPTLQLASRPCFTCAPDSTDRVGATAAPPQVNPRPLRGVPPSTLVVAAIPRHVVVDRSSGGSRMNDLALLAAPITTRQPGYSATEVSQR